MPLKSLGLASDVMVLGDRSHLEEKPDHFVLRSPDEPDFWFGNMIIQRTDQIDPERQIETFQSEFPNAKHITIGWDIPGMKGMERLKDFKSLGFKIDESDVLVLGPALVRHEAPDGITLRRLVTDEDWHKATELQGITGIEVEHNAEGYLSYIKTRMEACRRLTDEGLGAWFGAFAGEELVGDLGIYANSETARFQAVETRASYRRKGVCAALVTTGVEWAQSRYPHTKTIIVADQESAAGRVYRRCGFALHEQTFAVYKGPEETPAN